MAHTNETTNLQLPQFVASDKPTWLGDVNGAMAKIDASYGTVQAEATGAGATAQQALAAANGAVQTANTALSTAGTSSTSASEALSLANNALTVANNTATLAGQIVEDMGSLSDLDTTDKSSIVGAINEIAQGGGGGTPADISADDVTYSNTTSGLTATNVQGAIDELANTTSTYGIATLTVDVSSATTVSDCAHVLHTAIFNFVDSIGYIPTFIGCDTPFFADIRANIDGTGRTVRSSYPAAATHSWQIMTCIGRVAVDGMEIYACNDIAVDGNGTGTPSTILFEELSTTPKTEFGIGDTINLYYLKK